MDSQDVRKPSGGTFGLILLLAFILLPAFAIGSGNNTAAAIAAGVFIIDGLAVYFAPGIVAAYYKHPSATGIAVLNFLLGWTVLGWVAALVWAFTGYSENPRPTIQPELSKAASKACPFCAELIRVEAIKCKHCGSDIVRSEAT